MLRRVPVPAYQAVVNRQGQLLRERSGDFPGLVETPAAQPCAMQGRRDKTVRQRGAFKPEAFDQGPAQRTNQVQPGLVFQLFYHPVNRISIDASGTATVERGREHKTAVADGRIVQRAPAALAAPRGAGRHIAEASLAELVR